MVSSASVTEPGPVHRVSIYFRNEVLGRGVEAVLKTLPVTREVLRFASRDDAMADLTGVLITDASDADFLAALAARKDRTKFRVLAVVDLTSGSDITTGDGAIDGFISQQDLCAATLQDGLDRCARGEVPMPPDMARSLLATADAYAGHPRRRPVRLTARELETLSLLVNGLTNGQIARRLAVSSHGAKRLVASIMLKLNAPNRTAAVVQAMQAGLVDYPKHP